MAGGGGGLGGTVQPPGGGGTFDGPESRISRLVDDMKELRAYMKTALKDLAYLKGKIDAMPTTLQLILFAIAIFAAAGVTHIFGR